MRPAQITTIALLGCLVIGIGWLDRGGSQPPAHTIKDQRTAETDKEHSKSYFYDAWRWAAPDAITVYTLFLTIFTGVLGATAIVQMRYLRASDETARVAASAAGKSARAAIAAQRPWISAYIQLDGPLVIGADEARINVAMIMKNHGNTPAVNVRPIVRMAATSSVGNVDLEAATRLCLEISERSRRIPSRLGITIFPTDQERMRHELVIPISEMRAAAGTTNSAPQVLLLIAGCVDYTFGDDFGQTAVNYILTPGAGVAFGFPAVAAAWPAERLSLQRQPFGVYAM